MNYSDVAAQLLWIAAAAVAIFLPFAGSPTVSVGAQAEIRRRRLALRSAYVAETT